MTNITEPVVKSLNLDDSCARVALMDRHTEFPDMLFGTNENGEAVHISIVHDFIEVVTYQANKYIRRNIFYRDGMIEELFEGKYE